MKFVILGSIPYPQKTMKFIGGRSPLWFCAQHNWQEAEIPDSCCSNYHPQGFFEIELDMNENEIQSSIRDEAALTVDVSGTDDYDEYKHGFTVKTDTHKP